MRLFVRRGIRQTGDVWIMNAFLENSNILTQIVWQSVVMNFIPALSIRAQLLRDLELLPLHTVANLFSWVCWTTQRSKLDSEPKVGQVISKETEKPQKLHIWEQYLVYSRGIHSQNWEVKDLDLLHWNIKILKAAWVSAVVSKFPDTMEFISLDGCW